MEILNGFSDGQVIALYLGIGFIIGFFICVLWEKYEPKKTKKKMFKKHLNNYKIIENVEKVNFINELRRVV